MTYAEFLEQIAIVTVLYNKKWYQSEAIRSVEKIAKDTGCKVDLFIFDNGPDFNDDLPANNDFNCIYILNDSNNGVSQSYNQAAASALDRNKKWLLITDSDFTFDLSLINKYVNAINNNKECKLFCPILHQQGKIISPYKKVLNRYKVVKSIQPGQCSSKEYTIVNSGILCSLEIFQATGGYDPQIPLDFSDNYFMWKYSQKYSSFIVIDSRIEHQLSSFEKQSYLSAINRFRFFCIGSRQISKKIPGSQWLYLWAFLRMCKLIIRYRSIGFLRIFLRVHILGINVLSTMQKKNL